MPELPEITAYLEGLERTIVGHPLVKIRVRSPSLLRTFDPPLSAAEGRQLVVADDVARCCWGIDHSGGILGTTKNNNTANGAAALPWSNCMGR